MANNQRGEHSPLRLLCFDGGGVRGLSSLYIIKQLMEAVNPTQPPKPCHFFHMIGGTSTGGMIAIMLGRLEMSIDDCIKAYSSMMDSVFTKKQHRVNLRGRLQARFDTAELEKCIKTIVRQYSLGNDEESLMRDRDVSCKVFACAIPELVANDVIRFSSYKREFEPDSDLFDNVKVWEVCRATAAASTFFDPIKLGPNGVSFLDGATGANNPVKELWMEAGKAFGDDFDTRVQCVVSIGTGESGHVSWGRSAIAIVDTLKELATYTENAWRDFKANHKDLKNEDRLYRFNVVRGLERVGLEDAKSRAAIQQMTTFYMGTEEMVDTLKKFRQVSASLKDGPPSETLPIQPPPHRLQYSQGFLILGRDSKYVNANPVEKSYWSRLTLEALLVYEGVYKVMRDPHTGNVNFDRFHRYFANLDPPPHGLRGLGLVSKVWLRLPLENEAPARKDLVLAAIYMIHMEAIVDPTYLPNFDPKDPNQFSYFRNKFLGCYGNWVRCACGCGRVWSFANGIEGLRFDRWKNRNVPCLAEVPPNPKQSTGIFSMMFGRGSEKKMRNALRLFDKNRVKWVEIQTDKSRIQLLSTN